VKTHKVNRFNSIRLVAPLTVLVIIM